MAAENFQNESPGSRGFLSKALARAVLTRARLFFYPLMAQFLLEIAFQSVNEIESTTALRPSPERTYS
jgi:hypothetical protein